MAKEKSFKMTQSVRDSLVDYLASEFTYKKIAKVIQVLMSLEEIGRPRKKVQPDESQRNRQSDERP